MILPMCCDFHSRQCRFDDCEFAHALADIVIDIPQEQPSAVHLLQDQPGEELKKATFDAEVKTQIKKYLIQYRVNLQRELGRSTVGSVGLSSRFAIELIDLVLQYLTQLTSVEKVQTILPVYSYEIATDIFCIIQ